MSPENFVDYFNSYVFIRNSFNNVFKDLNTEFRVENGIVS